MDMDKQLQMADDVGKKLCKSQGGAYRNQGPKSVGGSGPKSYGDEVKVSSIHTKHDVAARKQGGSTRGIKPVDRAS